MNSRSNNIVSLKILDQISFLLSKHQKRKLKYMAGIQVLANLLDLISVLFFGLIAAVTMAGIRETGLSTRVQAFLKILNLQGLAYVNILLILTLIFFSILLLRIVLSIVFTKNNYKYLSHSAVEFTNNLFLKTFDSKLFGRGKLTIQEIIALYTKGPNTVYVQVLSQYLILFSDVLLLMLLLLLLLFYDFVTTLFLSAFIVILTLFIQKLHGRMVFKQGSLELESTIAANILIEESIRSYKELYVQNQLKDFREKIVNHRRKVAEAYADLNLIPTLNRYILEIGLIGIGILLFLIKFATQNTSMAVASISIFMAAGSRLAPALMRIQHAMLAIKNNASLVEKLFNLSKNLNEVNTMEIISPKKNLFIDNSKIIELFEVSFNYPDQKKKILSNANMSIYENERIGIIGQSGEGKTTLIDLILGILKPTSGRVAIYGMSPNDLIEHYPGLISYVPQNVPIYNKSILENVLLERKFKNPESDRIEVENILRRIGAKKIFDFNSYSLETVLHPDGENLSGGQRQLLGLARALIGNPRILILDESDRALDPESRILFDEILMEFRFHTTIIQITHNYENLEKFDRIYRVQDSHLSIY